MNVNLLRSKMALKGDYGLTPLMLLLNLSRPAISARINGKTDWTLPEMKMLIKHYHITEEEVFDIFGLRDSDES